MTTPETAVIGVPANSEGTIIAPKGLDIETATNEQCNKALQIVMKRLCKGTNLNPNAFEIIDEPNSAFVSIRYTHNNAQAEAPQFAKQIMEEFNKHTRMFRRATSTAYGEIKKREFSLIGQTWYPRQGVAQLINTVAEFQKGALAEIDDALKEPSGMVKR